VPFRINGRERPAPWYRLTGALNVLVWKLPLPRRLSVRLSALAYRSPPMRADHVAEVLGVLERSGVRAYCSGGWGIDVLLGRQTRRHRDLDLVIEAGRLATAEAALSGIGYEEWYRHDSDVPMHRRVVVRDRRARVLDLHPVDLGAHPLPVATGMVAGRPAPCLSAGVQEVQHLGYRKRLRDRVDLRLLRRVLLGPATALVIPVPDADAILDRSARDHGMPAPVTLVTPFMSGPDIDSTTERELAGVIERIPAFSFTLAADEAAPLATLSRELSRRWPDGSDCAEPEPVPPDAKSAIAQPLRVQADELWLMASDGKRWVCRTRFPLGPPCVNGHAAEGRPAL
jgi:lincosamide nucleotidyltransferase A/C/D/E